MLRFVGLAVALFVAFQSVNTIYCWRRNVIKARKSGIPYVLTPVHLINPLWLTAQALLKPILARLPQRWTECIDLAIPDLGYNYRYQVFKKVGSDTFLTVAPGGMILYTCDPGVINQITTRRNDFPKPTALYRSLNIYGANVVSAEGHQWRQHRKAISPPFTERNNQLVWQETIDQATSMLNAWLGPGLKGDRTVGRVMDDTMRLSLHVISRAGFGRKLEWPEDDREVAVDDAYGDPSKIHNETEAADEGHKMTYTYAIHCLLETMIFQFIIPSWLMRRIPIGYFNKAVESFEEWGAYMKEAADRKRTDLQSGKDAKDESMDILGQLVKSQVQTKSDKSTQLTDPEIMGNMFVLILAGHETAANSIHFALLYLALHQKSQRLLQKDLDQIFEGRPPSEWDYERDLPQLFGSMVGAVLNEELRLLPPVTGIPKSTWGMGEQQLTIDDKVCTVPEDILLTLMTVSAHRNPKYWPVGEPSYPGGKPVHPTSNLDNDLEEFKPERWLLAADGSTSNGTSTPKERENMPAEASTGGGLNINESSDTSERLFKPVKGSYLPFSDGYRSCIGRRFAQVEVLATLALIFQNHSIELAVDKYASGEEVIAMDVDAKAEVWQKAAEDARELLLSGMGVIISLQMRKGHVPVRIVPRGQEKFPDDADDNWKKNHPDKCRTTGDPGWRAWGESSDYHSHAV